MTSNPGNHFICWRLNVVRAPDFDDVIRNAWENFQCKDGSNTQIMFKDKMKHLIINIKVFMLLKERLDAMQKAKVKWGVEADENSKFFHGIVNRKGRQLAITESRKKSLLDPLIRRDTKECF
ncbi:hypothetical protein Tco_0626547 [Tanacetum coccineum]|uniref:RNA-directed DNA polymerase, eukaryota, reverse transcriptase zinc-binding domain protein n=1 Tax=Tanacetum coccineum TaxID=301880 RepID=A0ABQ4WJV3_9ASTR